MHNRRPATPRRWPAIQHLATGLAAKNTDPNVISLWGLLGGLFAGAAFAATTSSPTDRWWWLLAALLLMFRGVCNILDGLVAVEGGRRSAIGGIYNDAPDRLSDLTILIGLGCAAGGLPLMGCLAAVGAVTTAYVRELGVALGAPADYGGLMGKSARVYWLLALCAAGIIAPQGISRFGDQDYGLPAIVLAIIVAGTIETCASRLTRLSRFLRHQEPAH